MNLLKDLLILFLSLVLLKFFGLFGFQTLNIVILLPFFILSIRYKSLFKFPIYLLLLSLICSMISCNILHNQPFDASMVSYMDYFMIMFYFLLIYLNPSARAIEKCLFFLSLSFSLCYIYQYIVYPKLVFVGEWEDGYGDEEIRIRMIGMCLASLGIFMGANKMLMNKRMDISMFYLCAIGFVLLFLFGFRTLLIIVLIMLLILYYRLMRFSFKSFIRLGIGCLLIYMITLLPFVEQIIDHMLMRNETQNFYNKDYVRILTFQHFISNHFSTWQEWFFGSGLVNRNLNTSYSLYIQRIESYGLHYMDLGLLGVSWMTGVLSIIAMTWYVFKAYFTKLSKEYYYLGIWFLFLFLSSFTTAEFVRPGCFVIQALVLFLIDKLSFQYNEKSGFNK